MILSADDYRFLVGLLKSSHRTNEERAHHMAMAFHGDAVADAVGPDAESPEHYVGRVLRTLDDARWQRDSSGRLRLLVYLEAWATGLGGDAAIQVQPLLARLGSAGTTQSLDDAIANHLGLLEASSVRTLLSDYVALGGRLEALRGHGDVPSLSAFDQLVGGGTLRRSARYIGTDDDAGEPVDDVAKRLVGVQRGVLLGVPGAGKSWTLIKTAVLHGEAWQEGAAPNRRVPIAVPLRSFRGERWDDAQHAWVEVPFDAFVRAQAPALADHFDRLAAEHRLVFLVDALNEMPRKAPETGRDLLPEVLDFLRTADRFVVSCRIREYENELDPLRPLERLELLALDPPQIQAAIQARFATGDAGLGTRLWEALGGSEGLLRFWNAVVEHGEADRFWDPSRQVPSYTTATDDIDWQRMARHAMELCRTPLHLAHVCDVFEVEQDLPSSRFALLHRVIEYGLDRAAQRAAASGLPWPDGRKRHIRTWLITMTRSLQAAGVTETGIEVSHAEPDRSADPLACLQAAADAGIIEVGGGTLRFRHQQLQDYFGAYVLHAAMESGADPHDHLKVDAAWWDAGAWREATMLLAELVAARGEGMEGRHRVARWLSRVNPELALQALDEDDGQGHGRSAEEVIDPETRAAILDTVRPRLEEPHPAGRASAYRVLGRLGADDRPGVGLRPDGLPDVLSPEAWCEVSGGVHIMGTDRQYDAESPSHLVRLPTFWINRYPVTWAHFHAFLEADHGYRNDAWWSQSPPLVRPNTPQLTRRTIANHPVETVTWYEAIAYSRWLNAEISRVAGHEVEMRLPSEAEWEKAARGRDGRVFPWGDTYESGRANINEMWGGRVVGPYYMAETTAVGMYDQESSYGALDMAGNVWEWTRSVWGYSALSPDARFRYPYDPTDAAREDLGAPTTMLRVARGGSWDFYEGGARAAFRYGIRPDSQDAVIGFRLVVSSPISS